VARRETAATPAVRVEAPYVEARHLDIGYANGVVVPDVNFKLEPGRAMALIGTNGSGKSTLLKTLAGLLPPLGGGVSVFGRPPGGEHARIAYLGQFHQSALILPISAVEVVRMGRFPLYGLWRRMGRRDDDIVHASMRAMGLEGLAARPLRSLSGGQQQRTYLAQVLAHRADLLLLDEPTSGLDAGGRELFLQAVNEEIARGASVVMATHDIEEEAALCHQVILLARRVVAIGPPQEVITAEALLETFGIVVAGDQNLRVLECQHDDCDRFGDRKGRDIRG
jgi:ABC-type Mn2+/Zn2+ transport system ATPase subunit